VTLAFTTPCRFIPTLSNLKGRSTDRARAHFLRRTTLGLLKWHWALSPANRFGTVVS
jgi:hypothetical protein